MLGIIKKLAIISKSRIIGTISLGGKINDKRDTLEAENPKPLNPLTRDASKITAQKKAKSTNVKFIIIRKSIS